MRNDSASYGVGVKIGHTVERWSGVANNSALAESFSHLTNGLLLRLVDVKTAQPLLREDVQENPALI